MHSDQTQPAYPHEHGLGDLPLLYIYLFIYSITPMLTNLLTQLGL